MLFVYKGRLQWLISAKENVHVFIYIPAVVKNWAIYSLAIFFGPDAQKIAEVWENALIFVPTKVFLSKLHFEGATCNTVAFFSIRLLSYIGPVLGIL